MRSLLILFIFFIYSCDKETNRKIWHGRECIETSKVVEVESIFYRGGWVRLEDGSRRKIGQPHEEISVGFEFCTKRED